ncbi:MAG: hypothetical protein KC616_19510 [Myxococcales bacterium]|nr:hypothetical protein [Myxococcales bacterium]
MSRTPVAIAPAAPTTDAPSPRTAAPRLASGLLRLLDGLAYSSALAAGIGAALSLVASRVLGAPDPVRWATLTAAGAFCVYTIDRLRDVTRDRATSPRRTAFVARHRERLVVGLALAASAGGIALVEAPGRVLGLCAVVGALGLLHRRLKHVPAAKTLYVSAAWTAACVGIPWLSVGVGARGGAVVAVLLPTLVANLIASNLRDGEAQLLRAHPGRVLDLARGAAGLGVAAALFGPSPVPALAWIPVAQLGALVGFRAEERYGHVAVDGALFVGAVASWLQLGLV